LLFELSPAAPAVLTVAPQQLTPANGSKVAPCSGAVVQNASNSKRARLHLRGATDIPFTNKVQTRMASRKEQRADQREARCAAGAKDYTGGTRAGTGRHVGRFSDRSSHHRSADHPCAPAPIAAHQRGNTPLPRARQQCQPIGIDRAITYKFEIARDSGFMRSS